MMMMRLLSLSALLMAISDPVVNGEKYEVWGCDQSNSVANQTALGVRGSWVWIWDQDDVKDVVKDKTTPPPKSCTPTATEGPCDLNEIFPVDALVDAVTDETLAGATGFGRWHGITKDPQNLYVTANVFAPGGGYIGIVDATTKGAVALFRVTQFTYSRAGNQTNLATTRNVHMSFWNADGSAILIHNLAGKAVERINVQRDDKGVITAVTFDKSATVGVGKEMEVATEASYFEGPNAFGIPLLGGLTGSYEEADLSDLVAGTGRCKENGCLNPTDDTSPGRPNNVPICPMIAPNGLVYNTFGGGGLLVLDSTKTPMSIVGAYSNSLIYGAGVCGEAVGDKVYFTSGVSASSAGVDQSMWALYAFDSTTYPKNAITFTEDSPLPDFSFEFPGTASGGRTVNNYTAGDPRRDAHDLAATVDGKYVHVVDRILNIIDVFDVATDEYLGFYDLTTGTGMAGDNTTGACSEASVADGGPGMVKNDPAADFIAATPDGMYMMLALRGPAPVSAIHAAQGSCPGVGVVELSQGGASGALVAVLRSTNMVPDLLPLPLTVPQGTDYPGLERSDIHDVVVVSKDLPEPDLKSPTASPTGAESEAPSLDVESATMGPPLVVAGLIVAALATAVIII